MEDNEIKALWIGQINDDDDDENNEGGGNGGDDDNSGPFKSRKVLLHDFKLVCLGSFIFIIQLYF